MSYVYHVPKRKFKLTLGGAVYLGVIEDRLCVILGS